MEHEPDAGDEGEGLFEGLSVGRSDASVARECTQVTGAEANLRGPSYGVTVAEPAASHLELGLEHEGRAAELLVAGVETLLDECADAVGAARKAVSDGSEGGEGGLRHDLIAAGNQAAVERGGGDGDVVADEREVLGDGADAGRESEPGVLQLQEHALHAIAEAGSCSFEPGERFGGEVVAERVAVEDDDVDVGVREDFAPPIAAHRDELEVGESLGSEHVGGGARDALVEQFGEGLADLGGVAARADPAQDIVSGEYLLSHAAINRWS